MDYLLMDSAGNAVDSFDNWPDAVTVLREMVTERPSAALDLAILPFDDEGQPAGEATTAAEVVPAAAHRLELTAHLGQKWQAMGHATYMVYGSLLHAKVTSSPEDDLHLLPS